MRFGAHVLLAFAAAGVIAACGGGSTESQTGTLRLSLTDAPACGGYDHAWVTVEKVRVHRSSTASDGDPGWSEVTLPAPTRVDLLTLTNGTLLPLGQTELPAGTYTQMRLVLSDNAGTDPPANAVQLENSSIVPIPLTAPSGQQSGLKMNVNIEVPAGKVADFAIDFDACRSIVKAGQSGKYLLKPVLAVIPILSDAGQRVVGWVDPSMVNGSTTVSVQMDGLPVRATPPSTSLLTTDAYGRFTLYPVPAGTYDLVISSAGRVNAVMTGVPVSDTTTTVIGNINVRFNPPPVPPLSVASYIVAGKVTGTDATVRALQTLDSGPTVEVAATTTDLITGGSYSFTLPAAAPWSTAYKPALTTIDLAEDGSSAYRIEAKASGTTKFTDIDPFTAATTADFVFP